MGIIQDAAQWAKTLRIKPQSNTPQQNSQLRALQDGSLSVSQIMTAKQALCDEGSYFVATNPTPGTAIAYGSAGTQVAFSDTVPFMQVINTASPADPNSPLVTLDYLKLIQNGTAPASTTSVRAAIKLDNGVRAATAGTPATVTPVCPNMQIGPAPRAQVITFSGAVATIPASSSAARLVAVAMLKGGPTLNLDEYSLVFGPQDTGLGGGYLTTVAAYAERVPPVEIGPGQSATIHLWLPGGATNPFSYEFELGLIER